ncbi:MAG: ribonuclease H-like domain-containing protein [Candidatus Woesearchaeota archaeon]
MMIRNSFIFLNNFGYSKEKSLWNSGILSWEDFLKKKKICGLSKISKEKNDRKIIDAERALESRNTEFFIKYFPKRESWRLYQEFKNSSIFLDIETDDYSKLTVVSLSDGYDSRTFIRGFNLDLKSIEKIISNYEMIVTFNGLSFDLRILGRHISFKNRILLDLRPVFVRMGYNIGLKEIERIFGISRSERVDGLKGEDALFLWKNFLKTRNRKNLKLLIEYNYYDSWNLKPLAEIAYKKMREICFEREIKKRKSRIMINF